jgi:hypothetical protein
VSALRQIATSQPAGWGRPAVPRKQGPKRPVNAAVRGEQRAINSWMRLWLPEVVVGLWAVIWLGVILHPKPGIPVPVHAFTSPSDARLWLSSFVWPSGWEALQVGGFVAFVVAGVVSADFFWMANRRLARRFRWKWEKAARRDLRSVPRLRRIRVHGGIVDARISTRSGNWDAIRAALDLDRGEMLAKLHLNRLMGSPFRAAILPYGHRNPARTQSIRLYYVPLPLPDAFPAYEKPAEKAKVFAGHSVDGPVVIDLDEKPHTQVVGDTGTGKGQFIQLFEIQALRAGWLGAVIDGAQSPEYAQLDDCPTFVRLMSSRMTTEANIAAGLTIVSLYKAMADARSAIAEAFGVSRWHDIPPDVRAWLPPMFLIVDEITKLLSPSKDKNLNALKAELASRLDTEALRNGRKFGLFILLADQFAYSDVFSRGTQRQASNVIVLGNLGTDQLRQVIGRSELPSVPEVPRCGHFVRFGNPNIREIRVPFDAGALKRAVAYVVEQTR